ncbi:MAG: ubiquinone/menaquinone biosynthesis C-methylase UbiE [Hyphomicrobiaceae bacterium]|jgi:ubiquinone/menaquinone biosynthesis C-methylase UbiE
MSQPDNTDRFTGLADIYAEHRPTYPADVVEALVDRANAADVPKVAIDIGCGTGIATLLLAKAMPDWAITAAEPNADMLEKARVTLAAQPNVSFANAGAEALPLDDKNAGLVLAAQALHWFDMGKFFAEAARVLPPGGTLAILYNNRQTAVSVVLAEIESYLESIDPSYSRNYRARDIPALLGSLEAFENVERSRNVWLKPTSTDDLVNYFMSRSMLQPLAQKVGIAKLRHRIGDIADEHARAGMIDIPFATELDLASRRA